MLLYSTRMARFRRKLAFLTQTMQFSRFLVLAAWGGVAGTALAAAKSVTGGAPSYCTAKLTAGACTPFTVATSE